MSLSAAIGKMKVSVVSYNSHWPRMFEAEAEKIKEIYAGNLVDIFHIGSTSVPGLAAKPVIDIMPVVKDISAVNELDNAFVALGYECMGEFGITGRRYYRKGGDDRTHQIHSFGIDSRRDIIRHLAMRDYLIAFKNEAHKYAELKISLAAAFPFDIDGYCDGKDAFVKETESKAVAWFYDSGRLRFYGSINRAWQLY